MHSVKISYSIYNADSISEQYLEECRQLFNRHYGTWSLSGLRPGKNIILPKPEIRNYIAGDAGRIAIARVDGVLVGYAFAVRFKSKYGIISWITQLVVHSDYQNQKIATTLLNSFWIHSDDYAWGIVSANPYAIRALERATRRRCNPADVKDDALRVAAQVGLRVPYIGHSLVTLKPGQCVADTKFFVDHSETDARIERVSQNEPWRLGSLEEGQEWFAVTLSAQPQTPWSNDEWDDFVQRGGQIVNEAYERMNPGVQKGHGHAWQRHAPHEIQAIIDCLELRPGNRILDIGCGSGRHSIEFAKRGFAVTGIDFSVTAIANAQTRALEENVNVDFVCGDARTFKLREEFDAVICLYDVVGSFPRDEDNEAILSNAVAHLKRGGGLAISVMNFDLTESISRNSMDVDKNRDAIFNLPPSTTMQDTGNVWNPDYFILDVSKRVVFRREQFSDGNELPVELIVRDRRYSPDELNGLLTSLGVKVDLIRPVALGAWNISLDSNNPRAKEIFCVGRRI